MEMETPFDGLLPPENFKRQNLSENVLMSISPSLRNWWDSCARGTFLPAEPPCEVKGEAARVNSACCISYEF